MTAQAPSASSFAGENNECAFADGLGVMVGTAQWREQDNNFISGGDNCGEQAASPTHVASAIRGPRAGFLRALQACRRFTVVERYGCAAASRPIGGRRRPAAGRADSRLRRK